MGHHFQSLYAAVLIPRDGSGDVDERAFRNALEFLISRKITGVVLNGATGEYCAASPGEVVRLLAICREVLGGRGEYLCSIGSASFRGSLALAESALEQRSSALLLPMPHFFPYSQDDVSAYCAGVAASVSAPVLLYNLPRFTTPLEPATIVDLISTGANIAGVKDSSGTLDIFRALEHRNAHRFVGDDSVLVAALDAGLCEGAISGVAGVLPELTHLCCAASERRNPVAVQMLNELLNRLSVFPVPWGLKLIAECRGLAPAHFLQPVSPRRQQQACEFRAWFKPWWAAAEPVLQEAH